MKAMIEYDIGKHQKEELEEWQIFLNELVLNMSHQNVGTKELIELVVPCLMTIEKMLIIGEIGLGSLILSSIKLSFALNYPELSFRDSYTLEMREVKVYDY